MEIILKVDRSKLARMTGFFKNMMGMPDIPQTLEQIGQKMKAVARDKAQPHGNADSGAIALSIEFELSGDMGTLSASDPGAMAAEFGRAPNSTPPPLDEIAEWADSHTDANPYLIAKNIGIHGTEGLHFMQAALEAGVAIMEEENKKTGNKWEVRWGNL